MVAISMKLSNFEPHWAHFEEVVLDGEQVLRGVKDMAATTLDDEPTYAKLKGFDFHDGTISVKVLSRLLPDAPAHARGFIGLAFRIDETDEHFEALYIRPTNGACDIQLRRNRATQYFSYPDFKFTDSRATHPGEYESYADMALERWIDFRIEVEGEKARLYLDEAPAPVLVVNDLRRGGKQRGSIGLWVEIGTEGFFKDLKVIRKD